MLPHKILDTACLFGLGLDTLGGLYLAYDLLGGQRGILRMATKCITYGVMFFAIYATLLGRWFGLAGAIVYGPLMAIQHSTTAERPGPLGWIVIFAAVRSIAMGAAGWLTVDQRFGIAFALLGTVALTLSYATFGMVGLDTPEWIRPKIDAMTLIVGSSRGLAYGAAAVLSALLLRETKEIWFGVWVGIVTGVSSSLLIILTPSVGWWADNLPVRRLGAYGALLVVIGSAIQALQYLLPILGIAIV